jgi:tyrosine-protein kinase Etk/Wzc
MDTVEREGEQIVLFSSQDESTMDTLDVLLVLARRRRMIGVVTLASFLVGVLLSILLKPNFTATAIIMPPQQQSPSSGLLNQLGSLAALGSGSASALGIKSPADMYVGILQCRTIADDIIKRFHLQAVYNRKKMQDTRAKLKSHSDIEAGKDGLIQISVTDHDPYRASDLANAYVSDLYEMNSTLAISEAAQRRIFFDQQMEEEKKALATAEDQLRATQQRTGLIQLSGQAEMIIRSIADLRAEIASREVELQSVMTFATEQNPDAARLQEEINTMKAQLAKLENDEQRQMQPGDITVPAGSVPEASLEYTRNLRDVRYHETLFELLSRQYEAARIDEAKSAPIIQVVDHAIPPDKRSGPKRALILLGLSFGGFLLASLYALLQDGLMNMRKHPQYSSRFQALAELLHR